MTHDHTLKRRQELSKELDDLAVQITTLETRRTAVMKEYRRLELREHQERSTMAAKNPPSGVVK